MNICAILHLAILNGVRYNIVTVKGTNDIKEETKMKRQYVRFAEAAKVAGYDEWWEVEYENMGFCKDGVTRWYWFDAEDGTPCYTLKH